MSIDVMKQALEALENLQGLCTDAEDGWVDAVTIWTPETITALRQAIEQAEQAQPVAWRWKERINNDFDSWVIGASEPPPYAVEEQPLYTAPQRREWVGLTEEEIDQTIDEEDWENDPNEFARAIEAKLKEKNA